MDVPSLARLSSLAGLRIPAEAAERLAPQLARILERFDRLAELARDVPIDSAMTGEVCRLRADAPDAGGGRALVETQAPRSREGQYLVPPVLERAEPGA